jgi:NAD(P)-dependent dehydrogenase (short-subunit alcohol dehydrogenase family)
MSETSGKGSYRARFDLTGRVALVTGACGILGGRFAAALADHGANLVLLDLEREAAEARASELASDYGVDTLGLACDVSDPAQVAEALARAVEGLGGLDILVNNAASKSDDLAAFFAPLEDYDLETWRQVMAVNLDGLFLVAQAAGRQMIAQGRGGSIVQLASIYGVVAPDNRIYEGSEYLGMAINTPPVYSTSKAGVVGLTRHLAAHWAPHGIRVNALTPGGVRSGQNETFLGRYGARVPLGRMAEPEEMTGALVFLASDAASYVTGQNILVDGGLTVW